MTDRDCIALLQWALPRLHLRWSGFRNVRGQVCKRIGRRLQQLGLTDLSAYQARLEADPVEWSALERLCGVTISRFYRDRGVWNVLRAEVLPCLAQRAQGQGEPWLRCWSIGCASGEEPYTLSMVWMLAVASRFPRLGIHILATDFDEVVLERAARGVYSAGTLKELPPGWREQAFEATEHGFRLRSQYRQVVEFRCEDVRLALPPGPFDLMLCRNLVFTYFDLPLQREVLSQLLERLVPEGALVLGHHERLPDEGALAGWYPSAGIYRRPPAPSR